MENKKKEIFELMENLPNEFKEEYLECGILPCKRDSLNGLLKFFNVIQSNPNRTLEDIGFDKNVLNEIDKFYIEYEKLNMQNSN